jgi:hypothetical protein
MNAYRVSLVVSAAITFAVSPGSVRAGPSPAAVIRSTPLARVPLESSSGKLAGATLSAGAGGPLILPLPAGNTAGFGSAVAALTTGNFDYIVVGAPGAGRAFVYMRPEGAASFNAPTELPSLGPASGFGAAVAIRWGVIVIGAPTVGRLVAFSQPRDANGFPMESDPRGFEQDGGQPSPSVFDAHFGRAISMNFETNGPMTACGDDICLTFYQINTSPLVNPCCSFGWNQVGPTPSGNSAAESEIGALAVHSPSNNVVSIFNSATVQSYSGTAAATFNAPAGGIFTTGIAGTYDHFLAGVTVPNVGTEFFTYADTSTTSTPVWMQTTSAPAFTLSTGGLGKTATNNTDSWLLSNTDASGNGGTGTVFRVDLNRNGTFSNFNDDTWITTMVGTGSPTFGAGLAMGPDFFVVGDPGVPQAFALGSNQTLVVAMLTSMPSQITVMFTEVAGSPKGVVTEDPSCSHFAQNLFSSEPGGTLGPCVEVTPNATLIGTATVCYPNPSLSRTAAVVRCSAALPTAPASCNPPDTLVAQPGTNLCCSVLAGATGGANPICGETDHFSSVAAGVLADTDSDLVPDISDNCPTVPNFDQKDSDHDGVGDVCDNCPAVANPSQVDTAGASVGDACNCALPGVKIGPTGTACAAAAVPASPTGGVVLLGGLLLGVGILAFGSARRRARMPGDAP